MKLVKCSKNHYYDASKYSACPQCGEKSAISAKTESDNSDSAVESREEAFQGFKKRGFKRKNVPILENPAQSKKPVVVKIKDNETADANKIKESKEKESSSFSVQLEASASTAPIEDMKTVAYYDFGDDDTEPVVGWLTVVSDTEKGKCFNLKCGSNTIGRAGGNDIPDIDLSKDTSVSRGEQAVLIYEPKKSKFLLQASNKNTLIYLNDELVMNFTELKAYDIITVGKTDLIFVPLCSEKFSW